MRYINCIPRTSARRLHIFYVVHLINNTQKFMTKKDQKAHTRFSQRKAEIQDYQLQDYQPLLTVGIPICNENN